MADGIRFNKSQWRRFEANEIRLTNGKVLDSYTPGDVIVSRKLTQLADVEPSTALNYLKEIGAKYRPGEVVAPGGRAAREYPHLIGTKLSGDHVLEVPIQTRPIPQGILDFAVRKEIMIVEVPW